MGRILTGVKQILSRNPAIEFAGGVVACVAVLTPLWIMTGPPSTLPDSHFSRKNLENLNLKLLQQNYDLKQENENLRKKVQLLNQQLDTSSSRKP